MPRFHWLVIFLGQDATQVIEAELNAVVSSGLPKPALPSVDLPT